MEEERAGDGEGCGTFRGEHKIREIAEAATVKTWKRDMARILELVERR